MKFRANLGMHAEHDQQAPTAKAGYGFVSVQYPSACIFGLLEHEDGFPEGKVAC